MSEPAPSEIRSSDADLLRRYVTAADRAVELLDAAGIACAQMRTPAEFYDHPQLAARDRWRDVDSPGGLIKALVPPVDVRGRALLMRDVPALGKDDARIRTEFHHPPSRRTARPTGRRRHPPPAGTPSPDHPAPPDKE